MIEVGSNVRITVGRKQVYGTVTRVINRGDSNCLFSAARPNIYWDIEYEIDDPAVGRGNLGRWKQNVDGGYIQLA